MFVSTCIKSGDNIKASMGIKVVPSFDLMEYFLERNDRKSKGGIVIPLVSPFEICFRFGTIVNTSTDFKVMVVFGRNGPGAPSM